MKLIGVGGVVRNGESILTVYHKKTGMIAIPGGKADSGETPEEALAREMKEEVGIDIVKYAMLTTFDSVYNGVECRTHVYSIQEYTGTPRILEPKNLRDMRYIPFECLKGMHTRGVPMSDMIKSLI